MPPEPDPLADVLEILESLDVAAEDLVTVFETTENDSVRLGAVKSRVDIQLRRFDLMRQFGLVPPGPSEAEVVEALGVLSQIDLSDEQRHQLLDGPRTDQPQPEPLAPTHSPGGSGPPGAQVAGDGGTPKTGDTPEKLPAERRIR